MKYLILLPAFAAFISLSSCGGNSDAKTFCDCVKNETKDCDSKMEALEDKFKSDPKRLEAFLDEAMKICPDQKDIIERMK